MSCDLNTWIEENTPHIASRAALKHLFERSAAGDLYAEWPEKVETDLPIVQEGNKIYFKSTLLLERRLLELFKNRVGSRPDITLSPPSLTAYNLEKEQKEAIELAFENSLTFITGGPGTGKTYTAGILISEMLKAKPRLKIALAAPTGKAAGRLKESLEKNGVTPAVPHFTLHRLLDIWRDESDLIPYDLILVDESSMIDLAMMTRLFESLLPGARLILMGDPNQLPPVEAGSVFGDLAQMAPRAHLNRCLRAELQDIVDFAALVLKQDAPAAFSFLKNRPEALFWNPSGEVNFQVTEMPLITPLKKGSYGTEGLNKLALKEWGKDKGDYPIIITRNHDSLGLCNGDLGTLSSLQARPGETALINGRTFPALVLPSWELAWALSLHKCQGSEFNRLRAYFPEGTETFGVAALYTAVTRAKRFCEIAATEETLRLMIETSSARKSSLSTGHTDKV